MAFIIKKHKRLEGWGDFIIRKHRRTFENGLPSVNLPLSDTRQDIHFVSNTVEFSSAPIRESIRYEMDNERDICFLE